MAAVVREEFPDSRTTREEMIDIVSRLVSPFRLSYLSSVRQLLSFKDFERELQRTSQSDATAHGSSRSTTNLAPRFMEDFVSANCLSTNEYCVDFDAYEHSTDTFASEDFAVELRGFCSNLFTSLGLENGTAEPVDNTLTKLLKCSYVCDFLQNLCYITRVLSPRSPDNKSSSSRTFTTLYTWLVNTLSLLQANSMTLVQKAVFLYFVRSSLQLFYNLCDTTQRASFGASFSSFRQLLPSVPQLELNEEWETYPISRDIEFACEITDNVLSLHSLGCERVDNIANGNTSLATFIEQSEQNLVQMCSVRFWLFRQLLRFVPLQMNDQKLVLRAMSNRRMHPRWIAAVIRAMHSEQHDRVTYSQFLLLRRYISKSDFVCFSTLLAAYNGIHCDPNNTTSISRITSNLVEQVDRRRNDFWTAVLNGNLVEAIAQSPERSAFLAARIADLRKTFARYWQSLVYLCTSVRHTTRVLSSGRALEMLCKLIADVVTDVQRFGILEVQLLEDSYRTVSFVDLLRVFFAVLATAIRNNTTSVFHVQDVETLVRTLVSFLQVERELYLQNRTIRGESLTRQIGEAVYRMLRLPQVSTDTSVSVLRRSLITSVKNCSVLDLVLFSLPESDELYWKCVELWRPSLLNILHYYTYRFVDTHTRTRSSTNVSREDSSTRFCLEKFSEENGFYLAQLNCSLPCSSRLSSLDQWRRHNSIDQCRPLQAQQSRQRLQTVQLEQSSATLNENLQRVLGESRQIGESVLLEFLSVCQHDMRSVSMLEAMLARKKTVSENLARNCFDFLSEMSVLCSGTEDTQRLLLRRVYTTLMSKAAERSMFFDSIESAVGSRGENHVGRKAVILARQTRNSSCIVTILQRWVSESVRDNGQRDGRAKEVQCGERFEHIPYCVLSELVRLDFTEEVVGVLEALTSQRSNALRVIARMAMECSDVPLLDFIKSHCDRTSLLETLSYDALEKSLESTIHNLWTPRVDETDYRDWNLTSSTSRDHIEETRKLSSIIHFWLALHNLCEDSIESQSANVRKAVSTKSATKKLHAAFSRQLFEPKRQGNSCSSSLPSSSTPNETCNWQRLFFYCLFTGDTRLLSIAYTNICNDFCSAVDKTCELEIAKFSTIATHCLEGCHDREIATAAAHLLRPSVLWLLGNPQLLVSDSNCLWLLLEQLLRLDAFDRNVLIAAALSSSRNKSFLPVRLILELDDVELFCQSVFNDYQDTSARALCHLYRRAKANVCEFLEARASYPRQVDACENVETRTQLRRAYWKVACREEAMLDPITMTRFEEVELFHCDDIFSLDGGRNWLFLDTIMDLIRNSARERHYDGTHHILQRKVLDPFTRTRVENEVVQEVVEKARQRSIRLHRMFYDPLSTAEDIRNVLSYGRYTPSQATTRIRGRLYIQVSLQFTDGGLLPLLVIPAWIEDNLDQFALNPNEMPSAVLVRVFELLRSGQLFTDAAMSSLTNDRTLHRADSNVDQRTVSAHEFLVPVMSLETIIRPEHALFPEPLRSSTDVTDETIYQQYLQFVNAIDRL